LSSIYWKDRRGMINLINSSGNTETRRPRRDRKIIGATEHIHTLEPEIRDENDNILWPEWKFEDEFDESDDSIHKLIGWLYDLERTGNVINLSEMPRHSLALINCEHEIDKACNFTASLIVRSPSFRARFEGKVAPYAHEYHRPNPIINENIRDAFPLIRKNLSAATLKFALFAQEGEFIFGDGFFHDFTPNILVALGHLRQSALVPLTPKLALAFMGWVSGASGGFRTIGISKTEIDDINLGTQIYAKDVLFYRDNCPVLSDDFTCGEHLKLHHRKHPFLESLSKKFI